MRILVWGLGYVGTVTAACLAHLNHEVVGVEPNPIKVEAVNAGNSAVKEPGLNRRIRQAVNAGRLRAVDEGAVLVPWADVSLICVGTPTAADGGPALDYVQRVAAALGEGLRCTETYHVVALRSTVLPGVTRTMLGPALEAMSGRKAGDDFGLVMNPEFLRETSAIDDFHAPPYTVIGELDARSGEVVAALYDGIDAPTHRVALEEAELLKLGNNAFHALKVGFANEIGRFSDALGIDSHAVMNLVCADTKLNISPAYLRPGFAFGGSCLPKDLRALTHQARRQGVSLPILEGILPSNRLQIEVACAKVRGLGVQRVGVLGLSFKPGTDDLRESPILGLIQQLWQDGLDVVVYDPDVHLEQMVGSNRAYLERQLPQIHEIIRPCSGEVLEASEVVIVSQKRSAFVEALRAYTGSAIVLDLVRLSENRWFEGLSAYRGLSW